MLEVVVEPIDCLGGEGRRVDLRLAGVRASALDGVHKHGCVAYPDCDVVYDDGRGRPHTLDVCFRGGGGGGE